MKNSRHQIGVTPSCVRLGFRQAFSKTSPKLVGGGGVQRCRLVSPGPLVLSEAGYTLAMVPAVMSAILFAMATPTPTSVRAPAKADRNTETARAACVRILHDGGKPVGTGFFLDARHVATCWHVAAGKFDLRVDHGVVKSLTWEPRPALQVLTAAGEVVNAEVLSVPTTADFSPIQYDFAILRLQKSCSAPTLNLFASRELPAIGTELQFTGFPLAAPAMLTLRARVAGYGPASEFICVQAPVNKGSSGSALLAPDGTVLGIISDREGGLARELATTRDAMKEMGARMGGMLLEVDTPDGRKNVNQTSLLLDTLDTLDAYISTGIGYARSIEFLRAWRARHPATSAP